jgi:hypothetical protein
MTTQAVREKMVEEVENKILKQLRHVAKTGEDWPEGGERWTKTASRAIVDLIAERLADVTEEMDRAGEAVIPPAWPRRVDLAAAVFRAMLSASALPTRRGLTKNKDLP